jgi:NADH dehydrogenase FAD-containing subunit
MGKHLVLVGGGHAHMTTLANLHRFIEHGHRVTVIGPSDHHYYSGMGPGMLGRTYTPDQIRFATRRVVEKQGAAFMKAKVSRIDPRTQTIFTEQGDTCHYDVLSFNAGSFVPDSIVHGNSGVIYPAKPIEQLFEAQQNLIRLSAEKKIRVAVVGGGAAALELAGNVWQLLGNYSRHGYTVTVFAAGRLLDRLPRKVRKAAIRSLRRRDIQLLENCKVARIQDQAIMLENNNTYANDVIFLATGVHPSSIFRASDLPMGPDGGLEVNAYLQCTAHTNIFGGGDCIYHAPRPLDKVGVYAVRQNPVLYRNLMAALENGRLQAFNPGGSYLLIFNVGGGSGILYKNGILLSGRMAFKLKDYIDRRFMKKFQAIE